MNTCDSLLERLATKGVRTDREYLLCLGPARQLKTALANAVARGDSSPLVKQGEDILVVVQRAMTEYEHAAGDHARKGQWIPTPMGHRFWLEDPRPEEVDIEDIAYCLARIPRFNGATTGIPYSVAQHSVAVSRIVPDWAALPALLHDAHEAYIGDQTSPWKRAVASNLEEVEGRIKTAIAERFGYEWSDEAKAVVKKADNIMLATEVRDLMPFGVVFREHQERPLLHTGITPVGEDFAFAEFIERYEELTGDSIYV